MMVESAGENIRAALLAGKSVETADAELLELVENELAEDYLEGELSEAEVEQFKTNYLTTDERIAMLNDIRLLKRISSDAYVFDAKSLDDASSDRGAGLPATVKFILLAILAAFLAFAVWQILFAA